MRKARVQFTVAQLKELVRNGRLMIRIPPDCNELELAVNPKDALLIKVAQLVHDAKDLSVKPK